MLCKSLRRRTLNYKPYFYCNDKKKTINLSECHDCTERKSREYKKMNNISPKLRKIQNKRDKNLKKVGYCEYCKQYSEHLDPHEIYGGSNRKRSMNHGFVKLLCRKCHSDENIIKELRIDTQKEYEKKHTREEFINIIGKSYIE